VGKKCYQEGDYDTAIEYVTRAVELGGIDAHYILSCLYDDGHGIEKDEEKGMWHLEEAAISGHPNARYNLGAKEWNNKRFERAVKHFIIAANLGKDESVDMLKKCYTAGIVSKEDFAAALRAHQAAMDATKGPQREAAEEQIQQKSKGGKKMAAQLVSSLQE
jgi:TPR repeat protein